MKEIDEAAMVEVVRAEVAKVGSLRAAALQWGISQTYLSFVMNGKSRPGVSVLKAIGWERVPVTYQRRGK